MTNTTFSAVPYQRQDHEAALLQFIAKVLGPEKCERRRKVLDTIHDTMPGRERLPLRYVIPDGERIAGAMGHLPADFLVEGERVPARFTHDLLIDPDYRGQGLAKLIVDNARSQGDFFPGGMWMTDPCYKIHLACGFEAVEPLTTYTLVLDPAGFVSRKALSSLKGGLSRVALGVTRSRALKRARKEVESGADRIERPTEFDAALDPGWLRMAQTYGVTRIREADYLNWKYSHHPILDYRTSIARRDGEVAGYMVWRNALAGAGEQRAVIADFLVENGDVSVFRLLLSDVIVQAFEASMHYVSVITTQPWATKALRAFGFFPRGERNTWVIAGWKKHIPESFLSNHESWHVCLGDSDGDMWTADV